ncbi:MAG TPA: flavin reductase family protein [Solirubrobacterales bacterium]|nr:flavin reductase family protein [Solirubrobacterales bacterium]
MNATTEESVIDDFREAFTRFAATVSVITYYDAEGGPSGMTATSMCSLSLEPLSLLVCVNRENRSHSELIEAGSFGVTMLAAGQQQIADLCSRPGGTKRLPREWLVGTGTASTPVLRGSVAHIDCTLDQVHDAHSHSIFIGNVSAVLLGEPREPLLYCNRAYRRFDEDVGDEAMQRVWDRVAFGALS